MSDFTPSAKTTAAREARAEREAEADAARKEADATEDSAMSEADKEAAEQAKTDAAIVAERKEAEKQKRAADGVTGSANGDLAATAFGPLIEQAEFALRNQGHTEIEGLLDAMLAALQRLEGKTGAMG